MKNQEQKTILLVEDETVTMMVETHLLKSFGYAVVPAKSGEEAVQIATSNDKIALILMDVNLGDGIDGPEAAKQILLKRNLPVVFLSSHTGKEYVERIKGIAGYGYVVKNSGDVVLQSSIEMAFNLFDAQAEMQASKESFRMLYASSPVGIEIYDMSGRLISVNSAALAIFGLVSEDPIKGFNLFADPNISDDHKAMLQRGETIKYTAPFDFEKVRGLALYPTTRRGIIELDVIIQPLTGGCGYQVIVQDITARKKVEEALQQQSDELRARNDELSRFNRVAIGRELCMIELKREVNDLCGKLGEPPRHRLAEDKTTPPASTEAQA